MSNEVLVKADGVKKKFCRSLKRSMWYGLKDTVGEAFGGGARDRLRPEEFWAVNDVSFELRRGECLGLIGRNGAGKTTLLRMLNGLIKPDQGRIEMRGRVGALIALGAGFNPVLTGRENIYVNAAVLGLRKREVDEKLDEIIDYAEIREFIDAPVQTYSSGMQVRLGFSVATALKPDILILDEVLAVGDFNFRQKCLRRVADIVQQCAVIFVSHNFEQIERVCTRGLVMNRGVAVGDGPIFEARKIYDSLIEGSDGNTWTQQGLTLVGPDPAQRIAPTDSGYKLRATFRSEIAVPNLACRLRVQDSTGNYVAGYHSLNHRKPFALQPGENSVDIDLPPMPLKRGRYQIDLFLSGADNDLIKVAEAKKFAELDVESRPHGFDSVQL